MELSTRSWCSSFHMMKTYDKKVDFPTPESPSSRMGTMGPSNVSSIVM